MFSFYTFTLYEFQNVSSLNSGHLRILDKNTATESVRHSEVLLFTVYILNILLIIYTSSKRISIPIYNICLIILKHSWTRKRVLQIHWHSPRQYFKTFQYYEGLILFATVLTCVVKYYSYKINRNTKICHSGRLNYCFSIKCRIHKFNQWKITEK